MFEKSLSRQAKAKMLAQFTLAGNKIVEGQLDVPVGDTLADILNNGQPFVELELLEEKRLIAKNAIMDAREIMREPARRIDPYRILRIQRGASFEEVREAWKKRMKSCHPDRIAALGVDEEIEFAARRATQKINTAYDEIVTELKEQAAAAKRKSVEANASTQAAESRFSTYY